MAKLSLVFRVVTITITIILRLVSSLQSSSTTPIQPAPPPSNPCIPSERDGLLDFKKGLADPGNYLSSWQGDDCCAWTGISCSKRNGHVVELWLDDAELGGTISSSLLSLRHLKSLNLAWNDFGGAPIPEFIGSFKQMQYLSLSNANFSGQIPHNLGNLSELLDLYLGGPTVYSTDLTWLARLPKLKFLSLDEVNLSTAMDWTHSLNMLPSLVYLNLAGCSLTNTILPPPVHINLTSLEELHLSGNPFNSSISVKHFFWPFWALPRLETISLESCGLQGSLPQVLGNLTSLKLLDLNDNDLTGIPITLKRLHNLETLYLSKNNFSGDIQDLLNRLPGSLHNLQLYTNNLTGSLPSQKGQFMDLHTPCLSNNRISGGIPLWIGEHTNLTKLELDSNNLDGIVTQSHLTKLANLRALGLSNNSLTMVVDELWVPPFKLFMASLQSCRLGPKFPNWLKSQNRMLILDISNTSIADSIPNWFWSTFSKTEYLILSRNQIRGTVPTVKFGKMESRAMDFSMNLFEGGLPKFSRNLTYLDLSRNNISGPLPRDFGAPILESLVLFKNSLSGTIPNSFCKLKYLRFVDLSENLLQGPFPNCWDSSEEGSTPTSMGSSNFIPSLPMVSNIFMLNLNDNNLSGPFPLFLQKCQRIIFLDLAFNQFSGSLPTWIGDKLSSLAFLRLRSNMFTGDIPPQLSKMKDLQYLDLASNNFSGMIPRSLVNLEAMSHTPADNGSLSDVVYYGLSLTNVYVSFYLFDDSGMFEIGPDEFIHMQMFYNDSLSVVIKGQQLEFTTGIRFMVNFDLSCNSLTGHIPEEISSLTALKSLNLSWNDLSGTIPMNISALKSLESLDLSHNGLSGEIPQSISSLSQLSHLNLSYNNLSGPIPSGNQLQVLDNQASIYIGNPGLCGPPLSKNCSETEPPPPGAEDGDQDALFMYLGLGIGWATGLSTIYLILLLNLKWRIACFVFYDRWYDQVYVQMALTWASLTRASD